MKVPVNNGCKVKAPYVVNYLIRNTIRINVINLFDSKQYFTKINISDRVSIRYRILCLMHVQLASSSETEMLFVIQQKLHK